MANYAPSTRARIADLILGMRVETGTFSSLTYLHQDQWEIFNVYGRVQIMNLFCEMITDFAGGATLFNFNYTFSTPVITVKPLCGPSGSIAALVRGSRIVNLGGAVATAGGITVATGGYSDVEVTPGILGGDSMIGTIGFVTTVADATGGTARCVLTYVPMSDGAYVTGNALPA